MLTIRFARVGKRNKAQFKILLQEAAVAPGGRHVEVLGSYDPHLKTAVLSEDRIKFWLGKGAKASNTVHNLLVSRGIVFDKKRPVKIPKKAEKIAEEKKEEVKKEANTEKIDKEAIKPEVEETQEAKHEETQAALEETKSE